MRTLLENLEDDESALSDLGLRAGGRYVANDLAQAIAEIKRLTAENAKLHSIEFSSDFPTEVQNAASDIFKRVAGLSCPDHALVALNIATAVVIRQCGDLQQNDLAVRQMMVLVVEDVLEYWKSIGESDALWKATAGHA